MGLQGSQVQILSLRHRRREEISSRFSSGNQQQNIMMHDPTILPITLMLLILMGIAIVINLYKHIPAMIVIYVVYILFIIFSAPDTIQTIAIEEEVKSGDEVGDKIRDTSSAVSMGHSTVEMEKVPEEIDSPKNQLRVNTIMISDEIDAANRKVLHPASVFADTISQLYCFTGVDNRNGKKHTIRHIWTYNEVQRAAIPMEIDRSVHWRCWSQTKISSKWKGKWNVSIRDSNDVEFGTIDFTIVPSDSL